MNTNLIASMIVSTTLLVAGATAVVAIPGSISHGQPAAETIVTWN